MLDGAEGAQCLLRDTDSRSGSPTAASCWLAAPLSGATRIDASLHGLLALPPIGMPPELIAQFHGHSAKRFMLNVVDSSPLFDVLFAKAAGRFYGSTAQHADLEPTQAMLVAHELRADVLPAIYARASRVSTQFDLLARIQRALRAAASLGRSDPSLLPPCGGWGAEGPL